MELGLCKHWNIRQILLLAELYKILPTQNTVHYIIHNLHKQHANTMLSGSSMENFIIEKMILKPEMFKCMCV